MIKFDKRDMQHATNPSYETAKLAAISKALDLEGFNYSGYTGHYLNGDNQYQFVNTQQHKSFFAKYNAETGNIVFGYHDNNRFVFESGLSAKECTERDDLSPV